MKAANALPCCFQDLLEGFSAFFLSPLGCTAVHLAGTQSFPLWKEEGVVRPKVSLKQHRPAFLPLSD